MKNTEKTSEQKLTDHVVSVRINIQSQGLAQFWTVVTSYNA